MTDFTDLRSREENNLYFLYVLWSEWFKKLILKKLWLFLKSVHFGGHPPVQFLIENNEI